MNKENLIIIIDLNNLVLRSTELPKLASALDKGFTVNDKTITPNCIVYHLVK